MRKIAHERGTADSRTKCNKCIIQSGQELPEICHGKDGKQRTFPTFPTARLRLSVGSVHEICCTCNLNPPTPMSLFPRTSGCTRVYGNKTVCGWEIYARDTTTEGTSLAAFLRQPTADENAQTRLRQSESLHTSLAAQTESDTPSPALRERPEDAGPARCRDRSRR